MTWPHKRIVLKISGEMLGPAAAGRRCIEPKLVRQVAAEVLAFRRAGVAVALVVGGGNIARWRGLAGQGMGRNAVDHMGMLATAINALALKGVLEGHGQRTEVLSLINLPGLISRLRVPKGRLALRQGKVVIALFGKPGYTTDRSAALAAQAFDCSLIIKATKVDGVYDRDPQAQGGARRYRRISAAAALRQGLAVVEGEALRISRRAGVRWLVCRFRPGLARRLLAGAKIGSTIEP